MVHLKWDAAWTSILTDKENTKGKVRLSKFTKQKTNMKIWPFIVSVPVEVEVYTVSHFEATINVKE